jgi:hypothetical protein
MELKEFNNLPFHEQMEYIMLGKVSKQTDLANYPIRDRIRIDDNLRRTVPLGGQFIFGQLTGLPLSLTGQQADVLLKWLPNLIIPCKDVKGILVPLQIWDMRWRKEHNAISAIVLPEFKKYNLKSKDA